MHETSSYPVESAAIVKLVQDWALWRDMGAWRRLAASYTADAHMRTTWFDGPAAEFVAKSQSMAAGKGRAPSISWVSAASRCKETAR